MTLANKRSRFALATCSSRLARTAMLLALGALPAAAQSQSWIRQLGTGGDDAARAVAADDSGGMYAAGHIGAVVGSGDAWLARHDAAGTQIWIRQIGVSGFPDTDAFAAAQDGSGGVYVAGDTFGDLGGPSAGSWDAWLARYDGAGNQLWIRQLGTNNKDSVWAAAPDGSGGMYAGGGTLGNLGGPNAGNYDAWLARYDGAGNQLWLRQLGTSGGDWARAAAPDESGGLYVGGRTEGSLAGPSAGGGDAWLARYDGAGSQLWIRQLGTSGDDRADGAAPDGSGGVYVVGSTMGSLGGPSAGGEDAWLARYDSAGNQLWIRQFGTSDRDSALAAAPDGSGGVHLSGITFGSLGGTNAGSGDAWLAHHDGAGDQSWVRQLGTSGEDLTRAAAPDGSGGVYLGGETGGGLGGPSAGGYDAWLARYEAACGSSASYCTAKTTSTGCTPSIGSLGTPSKSGGAGTFDITVSVTRPSKPYTCFYSVNTARNAAPFQGGFLCMQPPVRRTAALLTSNAGECTSGASKDFGAILANASFISAGDVLRCEWWGRDTPGNSSLSDAIELTVCP